MRGYEFLCYQLTGIPYELFMEKVERKKNTTKFLQPRRYVFKMNGIP